MQHSVQLPLRQWGDFKWLPLSFVQCWKAHCRNGVVGTFGHCPYIVFRTFWWQISILWCNRGDPFPFCWKMIYLKRGRIKMFWSVKAGLQWQKHSKIIGWKSKLIHYKGLSWAIPFQIKTWEPILLECIYKPHCHILHCKYIRPDYDGTLAIHRSTIVVRTTIVVRSTMNG